MSLIKNLFYKKGDFLLDIPEWSFLERGIIALKGPSGSGKTSLLKILCGLLPCPNLIWEFEGKNLILLPPPERQLGVCFQDFRLFPHMTVRDNILFPVKARGLSLEDVKEDFEEIIEGLDLTKKLNLFTEQLSGGEQQRLALGRALILPSRWVFLDEPFSYLDDKNRKKARKLTKKLVTRRGNPLLLISHDKEDIECLADEEFSLEKGRIYKVERNLQELKK